MDILVVGNGGREHAICTALKKSDKCGKLYCAKGNAGIGEIASLVDIDPCDIEGICDFVDKNKNIALTVVAPDDPLALGLVDELEKRGHRAFGPNKAAAVIEASKAFSKDMMKKYGIPTAKYETFDDYLESVAFPDPVPVGDFADKIYGGWLAQVIGGALGTAVEGYCTKQIRAAFGEIRGYVRPPNTYNDDITYELAFLEAFKEHGYNVTAMDIALEWVGRIPSGWSAEMVALNNLRFGVFPPESGRLHNPFREWIGAQMRGAVCGLVAPGDPKMAARLAWIDGSISHDNNGIIGEVFNAMLVSLAFVEREVKDLVKRAIDLVPKDSEYYQAVSFAYEHCVKSNNWEDAWGPCETKFKEYNWIHAYPNAAAEVVAIYFSNNSFDECMHIIAMEGQDVDCNAAQIGTIYGVMFGSQHISKEWADPIGDRVVSYMRGFEVTSISEIGKTTSDAVVKARKTIE